MKFNYSSTRVLSTADLGIACDPPLFFTVRANVPPNWARLQLDWEEKGAGDVGLAAELVGQVFVNVWQGTEMQYPIKGKAGADELRQAIEDSSPGEGDNFICHLALAFAREHFRFLARNSAASAKPSEQSNGTGKRKGRVKVS